tara:strand:+ start:500 stop:748 length:249 start_codon:yes stop_codon:yes gene_type:complete
MDYKEYLKEGEVVVSGSNPVHKTVTELEKQLQDWLKASEATMDGTQKFMVTKRLKSLIKVDMEKIKKAISEVDRVTSQYKGK